MDRQVGWYADPDIRKAKRYWDGKAWGPPTVARKPSSGPMTPGQMVLTVAGGILLAVFVLWFIVMVANA